MYVSNSEAIENESHVRAEAEAETEAAHLNRDERGAEKDDADDDLPAADAHDDHCGEDVRPDERQYAHVHRDRRVRVVHVFAQAVRHPADRRCVEERHRRAHNAREKA